MRIERFNPGVTMIKKIIHGMAEPLVFMVLKKSMPVTTYGCYNLYTWHDPLLGIWHFLIFEKLKNPFNANSAVAYGTITRILIHNTMIF